VEPRTPVPAVAEAPEPQRLFDDPPDGGARYEYPD
jgi:hypothetical protein